MKSENKLTKIKNIVNKKQKELFKKNYQKSMEDLQKQRTAEPYLRFRIFRVEVENGK